MTEITIWHGYDAELLRPKVTPAGALILTPTTAFSSGKQP